MNDQSLKQEQTMMDHQDNIHYFVFQDELNAITVQIGKAMSSSISA